MSEAAAGVTMDESLGVRWSAYRLRSDRGRCYRWVDLVRGLLKTLSYNIVCPSEPRGRHALFLAVAEAKKGSWTQNCEGGKVKKDDT